MVLVDGLVPRGLLRSVARQMGMELRRCVRSGGTRRHDVGMDPPIGLPRVVPRGEMDWAPDWESHGDGVVVRRVLRGCLADRFVPASDWKDPIFPASRSPRGHVLDRVQADGESGSTVLSAF
jgi:hypothetical protein